MKAMHRTLLALAVVFAAPLLHSQASESAIYKQIDKMRTLSDTERPKAIIKAATDTQSLPAGQSKLQLADQLSHLVTKGDQGDEARQAVADALSQALAQSPEPEKAGQPAPPYFDLAKLVRYERVHSTLVDPEYAKAGKVLFDQDAEIEKADFTLQDLHGKKYTFSELRGKIVVINFWTTKCSPCRREMPDLDLIYTHFQDQGLVVLSITDEAPFAVNAYLAPTGYHPPVLIDTDSMVHRVFHVDGTPRTFVFDRKGNLVGKGIDQCTQQQFLQMLSNTDLHP
jgi:thiol-disulfide isomerase/thioredoxin